MWLLLQAEHQFFIGFCSLLCTIIPALAAGIAYLLVRVVDEFLLSNGPHEPIQVREGDR